MAGEVCRFNSGVTCILTAPTARQQSHLIQQKLTEMNAMSVPVTIGTLIKLLQVFPVKEVIRFIYTANLAFQNPSCYLLLMKELAKTGKLTDMLQLVQQMRKLGLDIHSSIYEAILEVAVKENNNTCVANMWQYLSAAPSREAYSLVITHTASNHRDVYTATNIYDTALRKGIHPTLAAIEALADLWETRGKYDLIEKAVYLRIRSEIMISEKLFLTFIRALCERSLFGKAMLFLKNRSRTNPNASMELNHWLILCCCSTGETASFERNITLPSRAEHFKFDFQEFSQMVKVYLVRLEDSAIGPCIAYFMFFLASYNGNHPNFYFHCFESLVTAGVSDVVIVSALLALPKLRVKVPERVIQYLLQVYEAKPAFLEHVESFAALTRHVR